MASVTLPSTSGSIHGAYASVGESAGGAEAEFEVPRPLKRCLPAAPTSLADSCKKRRKQATPVRISAADADPLEGKPASPECESPRAPPEPPEDLAEAPEIPRADAPWMAELQGKEWLGQPVPGVAGVPGLQFNPGGAMFMSLPPFAQPEAVPRQPIRIFNPDAYCDLCNKEFCNKYFLKTHKANKHGIYTDPPASEPTPGPVSIPSFASAMKLSTSVPSLDVPPVKNEPQTALSIINPFGEIFPAFSNKLFPKLAKTNISGLFDDDPGENLPVSNGFSSSDSDKAAQEEQPSEGSSPRNQPANANPTSLQTDATSVKTEPEVLLYTPPSKTSPGQREIDYSNRLRRIGVMNPKAFCEICCKEYCNKYFLRTHKMKRHGIYIPDEKDKDYKSENPGGGSWQQNTQQTSPLNLIMTEQNQTDRKTTSPADISCDICGIRFQNASLAQLHNISVHAKQSPIKKTEPPVESTIPVPSVQEEPKKSETVTSGETKPLNPEAISEDLQKLQTMILQLNDLDVNKVPTTCSACNREFENRYFLHAHMITDHGILLDDVTETEKAAEGENGSNNNTVCDLCGKDVQNVEEMKKHMMESHPAHQPGTENNKDEYNGFSTPEKGATRAPPPAGSMSERRIQMSLTPTSSYCEICNKELCNKYFMKTHMQRMHGIEIENGAQIGGVICDICNKELCSKYFLRVHKHNTHGIVEYGASLLQQPRKSESEAAPPPHQSQPPQQQQQQQQQQQPESESPLKPSDLADLSHRYFTHFTEVCAICSRRFRSTKWLKAHLLSDHGPAGAEKWTELEQQLQHTVAAPAKPIKQERTSPTLKIPNGGGCQEGPVKLGPQSVQSVLSSFFGVDEASAAKGYQCSFCPFTSPLLPLLFVHERSHSLHGIDGEVGAKCPVCGQSFAQPELLQHHLFTQHPFLPLPPFFNGAGAQGAEECREAEEETRDVDEGTGRRARGGGGRKGGRARAADAVAEMGEALREVARKTQLPATYALPRAGGAEDDVTAGPTGPTGPTGATGATGPTGTAGMARDVAGYVMQAFLLEESAQLAERRVVPAVVFLPVLQKQPAPVTLTFTLTPA